MKYSKYFRIALCTLFSLSLFSLIILPAYAIDTTGTEEEPPVGTWVTLEDGRKVIQIDGVDGGISDVPAIYEYDGSKDVDKIDTKIIDASPLDLIYEGSSGPYYYLNLSFQTQQNNYYCGPAAVRMALAYCGYNYSQSQLASMLGTTSAGTAAGDTIPNVMNQITSGSTYKFYWVWQTDSRYTTLFRQHCFSDLANSVHKNPIVVNTIEDDGVPILKGHEGHGTIAHFGVVNGIFQSGDMVKYTDPGYGYFSGFVKEQNVTLVNMCRALGGRGYVW